MVKLLFYIICLNTVYQLQQQYDSVEIIDHFFVILLYFIIIVYF
jgi:hypothetical protein